MAERTTERLVRTVDEHWMVYVLPLAICALLLLAAVVLLLGAGVMVEHSEWLWRLSFVLGFTFFLVALHGIFLVILGQSVSQIVITNHRVVRFHNIIMLRDEMLEVSYEKMKTVEAKKHGIIRNLFNYGVLKFENNSTIDFVPHPNSAARDIEQQLGNL